MGSTTPSKRAPGRPRNLPIEEQRELILNAARRVFAEHDYHGTSIERVAAEAGQTRRAVYDLFGGKEELFVAVANDAVTRLIGGIEKSFEDYEVPTLRAVVRANVAGLFEFIEQQPDVAAILRMVEYGGVGPAKSEVVRGRRLIERELAELFTAAAESRGGMSPEAGRLLALASLSMVEAVGFRQPTEHRWPSPVTVDFLTDLLMGGMTNLYERGQLATFGA